MSSAPAVKAPRLSLESAGWIMTPEEFDAVSDWDDQYRYELIRGVLVVTPFASIAETEPNDDLGHLLRTYRETHPLGSSLDRTAPEQYIRVPDGRRRADRVIWAGLGRIPNPAADVPAIAVEFVSGSARDRRRDYEEKRRDYLAAGVAEYWVIDRFRRTLTVFRSPPEEPAELVVEADGTYRTPRLPGFELPLARLLRAADDWATQG